MTRSLRRACRQRLRMLDIPPEAGTIDRLVEAVARRRGRPIIVQAVDLAASGVTGAWVPGPAADHVFHEASTSPRHRAQIVAHELSHMICGHSPHLHAMGGSGWLVAPETGIRMMSRHSYEDRDEQEAEQLADLLLAHLDDSAGARAESLVDVLQRRRG